MPTHPFHSRIISMDENGRCLDAVQLEVLEKSFREWAGAVKRDDHRASRNRILLIFLIIRYTGARLSEVLKLRPYRDINFENQSVALCKAVSLPESLCRVVQIPEAVSAEIQTILKNAHFDSKTETPFNVDPGHIRRKFYERAASCGFQKELGAPETIRKSRAVELMQNNVPLPVVQNILGHSTPNLAASYVAFSEDDIQHVAKYYLEKESQRKTSARNTFFGKVGVVQKGDVQAKVELNTISGKSVSAAITLDSLQRLGIKTGSLLSAEIKAPWVILQRYHQRPECTAENIFSGIVERIHKGKVVTEFVVRIDDGTEICSIMTSTSGRRLNLNVNDQVWVMFNSFSVVLHID